VQVRDGFNKAALHEALRLPQWTLLRPIDNFEIGIKSLKKAINTDFDLLVVHTWLTQRATDWDNKGRLGSALLSGNDLKEAETWLPKVTANQLELPNVTPMQAVSFSLANVRIRDAHNELPGWRPLSRSSLYRCDSCCLYRGVGNGQARSAGYG
jgi:hypothetical protein